MSLGNQRTRPNQQSNKTVDPLVSPVTPEGLADYLGLDYSPEDDVLLNSFLLTACGWYIAHMNNELLQRNYTLKFDRYPSGESFSGLSPVYANLDSWISIPLTPVSVINDVTASGDTVAFTSDLDSKPPRVFLTSYAQDITVTYTAGYATASDIPQNVILGINMLAGYLYEHRGACEINDAVNKSGAV